MAARYMITKLVNKSGQSFSCARLNTTLSSTTVGMPNDDVGDVSGGGKVEEKEKKFHVEKENRSSNMTGSINQRSFLNITDADLLLNEKKVDCTELNNGGRVSVTYHHHFEHLAHRGTARINEFKGNKILMKTGACKKYQIQRWMSSEVYSKAQVFDEALSEQNVSRTVEILRQIDLNRMSKKLSMSSAKNLKPQEKGKEFSRMNLDDIPDRMPKKNEATIDDTISRSAVLLPLCRDQNQTPCILVTLRSSKMNSHRWEVCFPGGKQNRKDDGDLIKTATRETVEELGIPQDALKIYGVSKPLVRASPRASLIYPVIGHIDLDFSNRDCLQNYNPHEVESVFLLPLRDVCRQANWSHTKWRNGYVTPIYMDNVFNGRQVPRIWGMTAGFLFAFTKVLLPGEFEAVLPV